MAADPRRELHEANRRSWNAATPRHNAHKLEQGRWLREGGEALFDEDYELLGPLAGKRVLHLQCNSGQDSLCLARRGAEVTGVDISDEAIAFARTLARDSQIAASFEREDIYDWLPRAAAEGRRFELVYSSYGWLLWLSDLRAWAEGVAAVLAPGGAVVLLEFHPFVQVFDAQRRLAYGYFHGATEPLLWPDGVHDYVAEAGGALSPSGFVASDEPFENPHPCHEFAWSVAELLDALRGAGLELERFEEWPHANGCRLFEDMVRVDDDDGRRFRLGPGVPALPLMLGLRARKPAGVPIWRVDAFTDALFGGNPAAVCVIEDELPDATMAAIAAENNLSETAFVRRDPEAPGDPTRWLIRWFTPTTEVDLCGHATLASAHVVLGELAPELAEVVFGSRSGPLTVTRDEAEPGRLIMNFPAGPPRPAALDSARAAALIAALGAAPRELARAAYDLAVFETEAEVRALSPDLAALAAIAPGELVATAPGDDPDVDFVSRFFAPGVGIDEDPVTGSAHCILAPYWSARLAKSRLRARQISARVGALECVVLGDRVELIGRCVSVSRGRLEL